MAQRMHFTRRQRCFQPGLPRLGHRNQFDHDLSPTRGQTPFSLGSPDIGLFLQGYDRGARHIHRLCCNFLSVRAKGGGAVGPSGRPKRKVRVNELDRFGPGRAVNVIGDVEG